MHGTAGLTGSQLCRRRRPAKTSGNCPSSGAVCAGSNPARTVPASGPSGIGGEFGVSRDTVQRVIRELRDEGWIETRQGSGSRVVRTQVVHSPKSGERPDRTVTLGPTHQPGL
ncbi:GntR family transcriptional regulator [Streptomyces sp. YU58]|uniref:GntR family transcriptional regulator n=1 Tax=Streptomyces sp. SX92 TaxID=3158972 RepID=UPI0027B9D79A|nr:GntR family transcriptional regulator [Streptomyces coralus]WLW52219.1 GntR family transcriptional regulator [Streptomyces coralus]